MKLCLGSVTETCCGIDCLSFRLTEIPLSYTSIFYSKNLEQNFIFGLFSAIALIQNNCCGSPLFIRKLLVLLRMGSVGDTGSISLHQYYATDSVYSIERIRYIRT